MASIYKVVQPSGTCRRIRLEESSEYRMKEVDELISVWAEYCERNWISFNNDNPFSPETKVKRFLDSLAYYLLVGQSQDIVTSYKKIMNDKREIPISSCPSSYENLTDASGASPTPDDELRFRTMTDRLDAKAEPYERKKKPVKRETRLERIMRIGLRNATRCLVDTNGCFSFEGERYMLSSDVLEYLPKQTKEGLLYDMVYVMVCDDKFFTENGDEILPDKITKA